MRKKICRSEQLWRYINSLALLAYTESQLYEIYNKEKFDKLLMALSTFEQVWGVIEEVKAYRNNWSILDVFGFKLYRRALDLANDAHNCEIIITSSDCPEFVRKMACQKWKQMGVKNGELEYVLDNRLEEIMKLESF